MGTQIAVSLHELIQCAQCMGCQAAGTLEAVLAEARALRAILPEIVMLEIGYG